MTGARIMQYIRCAQCTVGVQSKTEMKLKQKLARLILRRLGWTVVGVAPEHPRCVLIAAPHTSNWDFLYMLLYAAAFGLNVRWLAKKSLFNPLMGWFMRALGGIAVDRDAAHGVVKDLTEVFARESSLMLVIPTEATRARTPFWKSGFYRIAKGANVPIVPTFLDYKLRQGGFGPALIPTNDVTADMQQLRDLYADKVGLYPDQFGPVRLREESRDGAA